jgi:hypothetical protein
MGTHHHQLGCIFAAARGPLLAGASGAAVLLSGPPLTVAPLSPPSVGLKWPCWAEGAR